MVSFSDSVAILIYNSSRDVLVFVRQFRPPVMLSSLFNSMENIESLDSLKGKAKQMSQNLGYTLELCAGIIDKQGILAHIIIQTMNWLVFFCIIAIGLSPQEIAREEVIEETGYSPPLE